MAIREREERVRRAAQVLPSSWRGVALMAHIRIRSDSSQGTKRRQRQHQGRRYAARVKSLRLLTLLLLLLPFSLLLVGGVRDVCVSVKYVTSRPHDDSIDRMLFAATRYPGTCRDEALQVAGGQGCS